MRLSKDKINHLAHLVANELCLVPGVVYLKELNEIRILVRQTISDSIRVEEEADRAVRRMLASYSRKIREGSREWDVMYQKLYREAMEKRRR